MKSWKSLIAGFLIVCLCMFAPCPYLFAEENSTEAQEEETEEAIPESYYYPIESNEIKNWPQGPAIEAASATVLDMDSDTFLYSKNAEEKQYPASITKIMTHCFLWKTVILMMRLHFRISSMIWKREARIWAYSRVRR